MGQLNFTVRGMMLSLVGVAALLAFLANYSSRLGCGQTTVPLTFHVVDDLDGRPVVGAKIALFREFGLPPEGSAITGNDGRATATCRAGCTTYRGRFFHKYTELCFTGVVRIEARGYQAVDGWLGKYLRKPVYHLKATTYPPILVRVQRVTEDDRGGAHDVRQ